MVEICSTSLPDVLEIRPKRFGDARGFFSETYNSVALREVGIDIQFVQDNHSFSESAGVLRGLHFQLPPFAQDKLVRVTRGRVLDVAVDLRRNSSHYGKWVGVELSAERWNQLLVPQGFAHGFVTLEPNTELLYKVSAPYSPKHDCGIRWNDPVIGIDWPFEETQLTLSAKDQNASSLRDLDIGF